jgi:hypothetical protein
LAILIDLHAHAQDTAILVDIILVKVAIHEIHHFIMLKVEVAESHNCFAVNFKAFFMFVNLQQVGAHQAVESIMFHSTLSKVLMFELAKQH